MGHVFISYSREEDQPYARKLADELRTHDIEVWLDDDVDYGDRWWRTIVKKIRACAAFIVIMTPEAEESEWVEREILLAEDEGKPILPLLLRGKRNPLLGSRQYADVTGGQMPPKAFYDRLRRALPAPEPEAEPSVESPPTPKRRAKAPVEKPAEMPHADFEPELVHIPAGPFLMGSNEGPDNEQPQHTVELSEYWIGKYPVRNAEYQVFVRDGHLIPDYRDGDAYPEDKGDHPVVKVSWEDARAYCEWLSKETGKTYRLPTEAQWEKAARGEDGRKYPWGNMWDASRLNSFAGGPGGASPVGQYSPKGDSPYGIADMAGNVWEWCTDWFDEAEYERWASSVVKDPEGSVQGKYRVLRGGSFDMADIGFARCAARYGDDPVSLGSLVGFRVVLLP